jgi:hypothetical protein
MSLTYGSFGDVITTIQLVHRASQALSASRGSAREFQDLIVELKTFNRVLDQVPSKHLHSVSDHMLISGSSCCPFGKADRNVSGSTRFSIYCNLLSKIAKA